jgi:2-polyprenyl-3-methyl-5-hydroxy-6-metoxy-1,4-benzoquinol methylase
MQTKIKTDYSGTTELYMVENALKKYNSYIINLISEYWTKEFSVLEFGAGIGTLAKIWEYKNKSKPDCIEIDKSLIKILKKRGFIVYNNTKSLTHKYNFIYSSNVLEHIKDDVAILRNLNHYLTKNGLLIIYVPAFNLLYSELDQTIGHYRRYTKKELSTKLLASDFTVLNCHYVDSLGFIASLAIKYLGYKKSKGLASRRSFRIYDTYIFPISKILDQIGFKNFIGKNLFIVAKKNNTYKT